MRQNKLLWLLSLGWFSAALWAQTAATALPYSTGFEDATDNAAWQMSQGNTINRWQIDTAAFQAGNHALYISNDQGVNHAYSTGEKTQLLQKTARSGIPDRPGRLYHLA